jgi:hypothetical protein
MNSLSASWNGESTGQLTPRAADNVASAVYAPRASLARAAAVARSPNSSSVRENSTRRDARPTDATDVHAAPLPRAGQCRPLSFPCFSCCAERLSTSTSTSLKWLARASSDALYASHHNLWIAPDPEISRVMNILTQVVRVSFDARLAPLEATAETALRVSFKHGN